MRFLSNDTLIQKSDLALADLTAGGGILLPEQAQKFMRLLIKNSVLMGLSTVTPMASPKKQVPKIKFGSRVLRAGKEATALTDAERSKPDFSFVELDAQLFKGEVHLPDEALEDSIERGELTQTIMELMAEAVARDMEDVVINGDKASADPFLAVLDGVLKQATSNVVDAAGAHPTKNVMSAVLKTMPSEYLRDKKALRHLTSVIAEHEYRESLSERATIAGDKYVETDAPALCMGVPILPIPLFPENLGATQNQTADLLTDPKNIYIGIWRQIRIESMREISAGVLKVVVTVRFHCKFADELGVTKGINISLS